MESISKRMTKLKAKAWLEKDGRFLLSDGRAEILKLIGETGSLANAAKEMKMSWMRKVSPLLFQNEVVQQVEKPN
jgi:molybdate transport system regulatory protein